MHLTGTRRLALGCLLGLTAPLPAQGTVGATHRIVVEPDFLASRDGNSPHVETHIAANPRRARNLVAGAITHTSRDGTAATKAYASFDGGRTWLDTAFPEQVAEGGADPQVAFSLQGTALFATLNSREDAAGRSRAYLQVYRSEDGGRSWAGPADLGASYDHQMLAVDQTMGRFAGRIYLSALYGREYDLGLFRSDDDGRSFIGPVSFHRTGGRDRGANTLPMVVFRDGAVLLPFHEFPLGASRAATGPRRSPFLTVLSTDGGLTFSAPRPGPDEVFPPYSDRDYRLAGDAAIVVDRSARFPDRVYRVWQDARFAGGRFRIVVSRSDDRGATWSEPRMVDADVPAAAQQFLATASVNADGVLGVSWQDTREAGTELGYHVYFSASVDGGTSFLPPRRVTSAISRPLGSGNLTFTPSAFRTSLDSGATRISFLSAASRWINGGDYSGMAADADGVFHPFWADARSGTFQAWTARVRVEPIGGASATGAPPATWPVADITDRVRFVPDPSHFDAATGELVLTMRLGNTGAMPIGGPITITVRKFGSGLGDDFRDLAPTVLNAANGSPGVGATFILDEALGTERVLQPGDVSGPVVMRLRVKDPLLVPNMHLVVRGGMPAR